MSAVVTAPEIAPENVRPLRRAEYDALVAAGSFADERIELLYGALIAMSPQYPRHSAAVTTLSDLLTRALHGRAIVRVQMPLALSDDSEPEPDLAVVPLGDYDLAHPTTAHLVIEVAESTLRKDRALKARLHASTGVAEYWVVNLVDDVIETFHDADGSAYTRTLTYGRGDVVRPSAFPDVELEIARILPRRS